MLWSGGNIAAIDVACDCDDKIGIGKAQDPLGCVLHVAESAWQRDSSEGVHVVVAVDPRSNDTLGNGFDADVVFVSAFSLCDL